MEPLIDGIVEELLQHIRKRIQGARPPVVDLSRTSNFFTMDVITRLAFSETMGFFQTDSDVHGLIAAVSHAMKAYKTPLAIPWLRDVFTSKLFNTLFGSKTTDTVGVGVAMR